MSPIKSDMAEQGHKSRAAAAMLAGTGMVPGNGGEDSLGEESGIIPLRCRVTGR